MRRRQAILSGWAIVPLCAAAALLHAGQPVTECPGVPETVCDKPDVAIAPTTGPSESTAHRLDPVQVVRQVVDRYHRLRTYRDSVLMTQCTSRNGEETSTSETRMNCEIVAGRLVVQTSASNIRQSLGLELSGASDGWLEHARHRYNLWLAPHMTMRFAGRPLSEFRAGIDEGFTATDAEAIRVQDRTMVHLELRSGDGRSQDCAAQFDLFINPESMLIERIEGRQRMPDGASCRTTFSITPTDYELSGDADPPQPTT